MNLLKIKIEELNTRDLQTRAALNEDTVSDYAEAMERGDKFPPVTVFTDSVGESCFSKKPLIDIRDKVVFFPEKKFFLEIL